MATTIEEARQERDELQLKIAQLLKEYSIKHNIEINSFELETIRDLPVRLSTAYVVHPPIEDIQYFVKLTFKY
jgi:hypothetical protein